MSRDQNPAAVPLSRRRFVQGIAGFGAAASVWPLDRALAQSRGPVLSGTEFRLEIGPMAVNYTGRPRTAYAINGQIPAPTLRWREGDTITLAVSNRLSQSTSIHWHGIRTPSPMDGVPGLSFHGIPPGQTFDYRFTLLQSGTYWYHSHSAFQEQSGVYGPIIIEPRGGYARQFDRDYIVFLSDWSDESPETIIGNLKFQPDYYNFRQRTLGTFIADVSRMGLAETISDRLMWGEMRMSPTDILDVSGATYTYLMNGQSPAWNWTGLFRPGERVRLRFINGSAMSIFDVSVPGLPLTVIQTDGNDVRPVEVDQFRIGTAETYDVIVEPREARAYTIFAQAEDRTGYARGTLAPAPGMSAAIPPMDPRPMRTMKDMGMEHGSTGHGSMGHGATGGAQQMNHGAMSHASALPRVGMTEQEAAAQLRGSVGVDNVAMAATERLNEPGQGFPPGRRVLRYGDLRNAKRGNDPRPPEREIVLHLTGNMERFMWGFDGKKFSEAPQPIELRHNERVRFTLINDTMMEHPMHLHGLWMELENGQGEYRPYKHTILVKPGERLSFLVNADEPGRWAFHCHLLFHMEAGMFREVRVG
jgi:CopA family copper-resistance protein